MASVLIVEDEQAVAEDLARMLESLGHEVVACVSNFSDAIAAVLEYSPDLAILNLHLKESRDGAALAMELREEHDVAIAFLTSDVSRDLVARVASVRPNGFLQKPFDADTVNALIVTALANFSGSRGLDLGCCALSSVQALTEHERNALLAYIERNLDKPIRTSSLAAVVKKAERTFSRLFKLSFKISPQRYISELRIAEAKRLLRNTEWTLADIALAVGFSSQSNFTAAFTKVQGISPSQYRKLAK